MPGSMPSEVDIWTKHSQTRGPSRIYETSDRVEREVELLSTGHDGSDYYGSYSDEDTRDPVKHFLGDLDRQVEEGLIKRRVKQEAAPIATKWEAI